MKLIKYGHLGLYIYGARIFLRPICVNVIPITSWDFCTGNIPYIDNLFETIVLHSTYSYIVSK